MKRILLLLVLCLLPSAAAANPVSFKDGWGLMPSYGGDWSDLQINYSYSNRASVGLAHFYRDGEDSTANFGIGEFNYLFKRWNELESQANMYGSLGLGGVDDSHAGSDLAGYAAFQADYETRRIYTVLGYDSLFAANGVDFHRIRARAGVAPYLAPFDELNTWVVLQVEWMPEMEEEVVVTPLVRLFYNNFALELGVSLEGAPFVGGMAHF